MNKFKIPEVQSLGRVLTKEELKAIIGGKTVTISCTCKLHLEGRVNGAWKAWTEDAEPKKESYTADMCKAACEELCDARQNCKSSDYFYTQSGSGS